MQLDPIQRRSQYRTFHITIVNGWFHGQFIALKVMILFILLNITSGEIAHECAVSLSVRWFGCVQSKNPAQFYWCVVTILIVKRNDSKEIWTSMWNHFFNPSLFKLLFFPHFPADARSVWSIRLNENKCRRRRNAFDDDHHRNRCMKNVE